MIRNPWTEHNYESKDFTKRAGQKQTLKQYVGAYYFPGTPAEVQQRLSLPFLPHSSYSSQTLLFAFVDVSDEIFRNLKTCQLRLAQQFPFRLKAVTDNTEESEETTEACSGKPTVAPGSDPSQEINTTTYPYKSKWNPEDWDIFVTQQMESQSWG